MKRMYSVLRNRYGKAALGAAAVSAGLMAASGIHAQAGGHMALKHGDSFTMQIPNGRAFGYQRRADCTRFTVAPGDQSDYDRAHNRPFERSELISDRKLPFDTPVGVSFWQYVMPGAPTTVPTIVGQFHNSAHSGITVPPPVAFEIGGTAQRLVIRSAIDPKSGVLPPRNIVWTGPVTPGQWVRWEVRVAFDPKRGRVQLWRNGDKVADRQMPVGYNDPVGPYWQFGIYRPAAPETVDILYAKMRQQVGGDLFSMPPSPSSGPPSLNSCPAAS